MGALFLMMGRGLERLPVRPWAPSCERQLLAQYWAHAACSVCCGSSRAVDIGASTTLPPCAACHRLCLSRRCLPATSWRLRGWTCPSSSRPRWPPPRCAARWPPCCSRSACTHAAAGRLLSAACRRPPPAASIHPPAAEAVHPACSCSLPPAAACSPPPSCAWRWSLHGRATCRRWPRGCACCTRRIPWSRWRCRTPGSTCCVPQVGGGRARAGRPTTNNNTRRLHPRPAAPRPPRCDQPGR